MKQFYFRKSSRRLLTAFMVALFAGTMTASAETVTDDFSGYTTTTSGTTLGDNWVIIPGTDGSWASFGSDKEYIHYNEYGEHYVAGNSASNYTKGVWLVLKKQVTGTVTFTATNGDQSSTFTIYVSKAAVSGDSYEVTGTAQSYSVPSRTSTAKTYTFDAGTTPTYVAFCLVGTKKNPKLQSVTYTEFTASNNPELKVSDFVSGSSYDFGGIAVPAGTTKTFTLNNVGLSALTISSIAVTGGYTITEGASLTSIAAEGSADVTIATPAADATGALTITSNDANSPYVINLSSTYKVPTPIMGLDFTNVSFGKVTANANQTITVSNTGDASLTATIASSDATRFTVSPANVTVAAGETGTFTITYNYVATDYGTHAATITVTPNVGDAQQIAVSAKVQDPNVWSEDFSGNALPDGWSADAGWTFADGKAKSTYITGSAAYLTTPALIVSSTTDELTFDYETTGNYVNILVEKSKDGGEWTDCTTNPSLRTYMSNGTSGTATITGLEAGSYKFRFTDDSYNLDNFEGFKLNENAPEMVVDPTTDADFGNKVKAQPEALSYSITNAGTGTLEGTIVSSDATQFTVSKSSFSLGKGESTTFDVALVFDTNYGAKAATITIHPTNAGLTDVVINASATTADPNIWEEDFADGIPSTWINENNAWTTNRYAHTGQAGPGSDKTSTLTTPRLLATTGQVLQFDVIDAESETYFLKAEYSNNRTEWTLIDNYTDAGTKEFTAPADGYYWLRFTGYYTYVDNFYGFKEAPLDHDVAITAQSIPATGYQYAEYKASVTVKEMTGKAEELTVKFFIGTTQYGESVVKNIAANASETITVTFTPEEAVSGKTYFTITGTGIDVTSTETDVVINAATVWKDTETNEVTAGVYPALVIQYTLAQGWNSICLPAYFYLSDFDSDGLTFFSFSGYEGGALKFSKETTMINAATPYLVYSTKAATINFKHTDISIFSYQIGDENTRTTKNGAIFQGTYTPMAAGTLTGKYGVIPATGKIVKGDATTTMKGFRAYFELPAGATAPTISIDDETTGIRPTPSPSLYGGEWYDLSGRKVESSKSNKGLYIVNGKKVVVK